MYKDDVRDDASCSVSIKVPVVPTISDYPVEPAGYMVYDSSNSSLYYSDGVSWNTAGGSIPNASYVVVSADPSLPNERVLSVGSSLTATDGGAGGDMTLDLSDTTVMGGTYFPPEITADVKGRVTSINNFQHHGFRAVKSGDQAAMGNNVAVINWSTSSDETTYNTGSFNETTGVFTTPVTGYYNINITYLVSLTDATASTLRTFSGGINGTIVSSFVYYIYRKAMLVGDDLQFYASQSLTVFLSQNQQINPRVSMSTIPYTVLQNVTTFSIALIQRI